MIRDLSITEVSRTQASNTSASQHLIDLIVVLTQKEIKVRYKNSWLGYAWSVANPLLFALVYYIAFGLIMRTQIANYPLFLIAGLFPWQWIANSMNGAPLIFLANAILIKRVRFPRYVLVVSTVLNDGLHFVLSIPVLVAFLLFYGLAPSWSWLVGIPLLVVAQFMTACGLALAIASLNLFFRDLDRLTSLLVTVLFFLTPIAYSGDMIPSEYRLLWYLNPVAPVIMSWQQLFLGGRLDWPLLGVSVINAGVAVGLGVLIFAKLSPRFAEVV